MKILRPTISLLVAVFFISIAYSQEVTIDSNVEWQSLEEAQKEAKKTGKKILIFGYAEWCTYCRKMRKETYPAKNVQKSLNEDFIPVQINGESEEEVVFNGKKYKSVELARYLRFRRENYRSPTGIFTGRCIFSINELCFGRPFW